MTNDELKDRSRIRELAIEAGIIIDFNDPLYGQLSEGTKQKQLVITKKFAELIVRECCDWIDGSPATDAGQLLLTKSFIIANLKGHFGVER